jgi:chromosome segregation protein
MNARRRSNVLLGGVLESSAPLATLEQARAQASRLAEAIHAHELEAGEARHRRTRIVERIRDDYDIAIEDVVAQDTAIRHDTAACQADQPAAAADGQGSDAGDAPIIPSDRGELDAEIETLRRKLSSMTSVNMEALAEAEALTERLTGLETQLADVTNAKLAIEQLVSRIDDESRRLLGETIETVRGHFRELFERVFGGGQADIVLEPGVDLLETSVEIVSRPPGKEPRSISLLSGGEKAMAAIAFIFAIFLTALSVIPLGSGIVTIPFGIGLMFFGNVAGGLFIEVRIVDVVIRRIVERADRADMDRPAVNVMAWSCKRA